MELVVVLLVLVLFAALIAPNLISMRAGQRSRAAYGQIIDLISEARTDAVGGNLTYAITWDSGTSQFQLKKEPPNPNSQDTSGSLLPPEPRPMQTSTTADQFDQVKSISVPSNMRIDTFRTGTSNTDAGSWAMHFYPDGTSDGGGFQIGSGSDVQSVVIDKFGLAQLQPGTLPDTTDQSWTAGTYVQKI